MAVSLPCCGNKRGCGSANVRSTRLLATLLCLPLMVASLTGDFSSSKFPFHTAVSAASSSSTTAAAAAAGSERASNAAESDSHAHGRHTSSITQLLEANEIGREDAVSLDWHYARAAPSLYVPGARGTAPLLHFALVVTPATRDLRGAFAVLEELAYAGHAATLVAPVAAFCGAIEKLAGRLADPALARCVVLGSRPDSTGESPQQQPQSTAAAAAAAATAVEAIPFDERELPLAAQMSQAAAYHDVTLAALLATLRAVSAARPVTTLLCGSHALACGAAAAALEVPAVWVWASPEPLTLQLDAARVLPGSGLPPPRLQSRWQRAAALVRQTHYVLRAHRLTARLRRARLAAGVPPPRSFLEAVGLHDMVVLPTLWGLDPAPPRPLCPNVHVVGPLVSRAAQLATPLATHDPGVAEFLRRCAGGVVYVNFGSRALPAGFAARLHAALSAEPFCVLWRLADADAAPLRRQRTAAPSSPSSVLADGENATAATLPSSDSSDSVSNNRTLIQPWFSSAADILRHRNVFAYVTHCGAEGPREAVAANLPLLGVPVTAHDAERCAAAEAAGVAICVATDAAHLSATALHRGLWDVVRHNAQYNAALRRARVAARFLGGAPRAAALIQGRQYNLLLRRGGGVSGAGGESTAEVCVAALERAQGGLLGLLALSGAAHFLALVFIVAIAGFAAVCALLRGARGVYRRRARARVQPARFRVVPRPYEKGQIKDELQQAKKNV